SRSKRSKQSTFRCGPASLQSSLVARCSSLAAGRASVPRWRLTLPSRGRPTSGFACCWPPLMSNVRRSMRLPLVVVFTICTLCACAGRSNFVSYPMQQEGVFKAPGLDEPLRLLSGPTLLPHPNQLPPEGIDAVVRVRYTVDEQGRTKDIIVLSSSSELFSSL